MDIIQIYFIPSDNFAENLIKQMAIELFDSFGETLPEG